MTSSKRKYAFWPSRRTLKGCVSEFIHPGTWFQKTPFSCDAFTGFVWTIGQNDAKHLRFNQKTAPCGRALSVCGGPISLPCVKVEICQGAVAPEHTWVIPLLLAFALNVSVRGMA